MYARALALSSTFILECPLFPFSTLLGKVTRCMPTVSGRLIGAFWVENGGLILPRIVDFC